MVIMGSDRTNAMYMQLAIKLAMRGRGFVEPNPMVGCVIVKGDRIIGQGRHERYGGPHAEPNALAACSEPSGGATVYVTLEPCCHADKQTPPCVPRLIAAGVKRIVIACLDPNPEVSGKGVAQLRAAGIQVEVGCREAEAKQLASPFFSRIVEQRPYVTLKWAQTVNGKVAGPGGRRMRISNESSTQVVHQLRAGSDAILVGVNTVLADDPMLTARGVDEARPLLRIVLDTDLRTPLTSKLAESARDFPLRIYCSRAVEFSDRAALFRAKGVAIAALAYSPDPCIHGPLFLGEMLLSLGRENLTHLLVEPGPTLAASFFRQNRVDRLWIFRSQGAVNDATAPAAAQVPSHFLVTGEVQLAGDTLTEYLNPAGPAFFAPTPSADMQLLIGRGIR